MLFFIIKLTATLTALSIANKEEILQHLTIPVKPLIIHMNPSTIFSEHRIIPSAPLTIYLTMGSFKWAALPNLEASKPQDLETSKPPGDSIVRSVLRYLTPENEPRSVGNTQVTALARLGATPSRTKHGLHARQLGNDDLHAERPYGIFST